MITPDSEYFRSEIFRSQNRARAYQQGLLQEGLREAESRGISLIIPTDERGYLDIRGVLGLGQIRNPSLYRKFSKKMEELEGLLAQVNEPLP